MKADTFPFSKASLAYDACGYTETGDYVVFRICSAEDCTRSKHRFADVSTYMVAMTNHLLRLQRMRTVLPRGQRGFRSFPLC